MTISYLLAGLLDILSMFDYVQMLDYIPIFGSMLRLDMSTTPGVLRPDLGLLRAKLSLKPHL